MQTIRLIVRTWNNAVAETLVGSSTVLTVPGVNKRNFLRHDLPHELLTEIDTWAASCRRGRLSDKTTRKRHYLALRIASDHWTLTSQPPASLDELLTYQAAEAVVTALATRTRRESPSAYETARTFCDFAKWRCPQNFDLIQDLERLRIEHAPKARHDLSRKNRDLLRHFFKYENTVKLRSYPFDRYRELFAKPNLEPEDYTELTVAFAVHLMMAAPLPPGLICSATIGPNGNVREQLLPARRVSLCWSRPPKSSAGPLEYELSGESLLLYDQYVSRVRAAHPGAATPYLFPGRGWRHKSPIWFSQQIAQVTARPNVVGVRMNTSSFRLVFAFILLAEQSNANELAGWYLGHTRSRSLKRLVDQVERWRAEGFFNGWPCANVATASR